MPPAPLEVREPGERLCARRTRGKARVKKGQRLGVFQTRRGKFLILGKERTFALDPRHHRGVRSSAYPRLGPERGDVVKLWSYTDRVQVSDRILLAKIVD